MKITLVSADKKLVDAWKWAFASTFSENLDHKIKVSIIQKPTDAFILDYTKYSGIVLPTTTFCDTSRGVCEKIVNKFTFKRKNEIRKNIIKNFNGELPIGQTTSFSFKLGQEKKQLLISPVMRVFEKCDKTVNVYTAFKGLLEFLLKNYSKYQNCNFVCTGFCQDSDFKMLPVRCAYQMRCAYDAVVVNGGEIYLAHKHHKYLEQLQNNHVKMTTITKPFTIPQSHKLKI